MKIKRIENSYSAVMENVKKKSSIAFFPEAGYSFDGTLITLPDTTAKLIKYLGIPVDICMTVDTKLLYHVGGGRLRHNQNGFILEGDDGVLSYEQKPTASYTVNFDFNWY